MLCKNCNKEIANDALVCPYCGMPVKKEEGAKRDSNNNEVIDNIRDSINNGINSVNDTINNITDKNISFSGIMDYIKSNKAILVCLWIFLFPIMLVATMIEYIKSNDTKAIPIWKKVILWICLLPIMGITITVKSKKLNKLAKGIIIILICFVWMSACSGETEETNNSNKKDENVVKETVAPKKVVLKKISDFEEKEYSQIVGDKKEFKLAIEPVDVKLDDIEFEIEDKKVIKVTDIQKIEKKNNKAEICFIVEAIGKGSSKLVVNSSDNKVKTNSVVFKVEELIKVEEISNFDKDEYTKYVGESIELKCEIKPEGLEREEIIVENKDSSIIEISDKSFENEEDCVVLIFNVKAKKVGNSEIIVKSKDGDVKSNVVKIIVKKKETKAKATAKPTAKPTHKPTAKPTKKPASKNNGNSSSDNKEKVWIPQSGSKYHSHSSCSNMSNPTQVTLDVAKSRGYTPCKRCH